MTIKIELICDVCGDYLDHNERNGFSDVIPCKQCLQKEYEKGYEDGEGENK